MPYSPMERLFSTLVYGFTLIAIGLVAIYLVIGNVSPLLFVALAAPWVFVILFARWKSRYVLTHAVHALILFTVTCMVGLLPMLLHSLQQHGFLQPKGVAILGRINPVTYLQGAAVIIFGVPLVCVAYESLFEAAKGRFLDNWPPLRWVRTWLMPGSRDIPLR